MNANWKNIVGTVAPALATALGGPLAGMATSAISQAVLGRQDGSVEDVSSAVLSGGPEVLARLKEAEYAFREKMKKLDIDLEEIAATDRVSARDREKTLRDRTPAVLAGFVFAGFFGILGALIFVSIPDVSLSPLNIMLGSLATIVVQIAAYYFGSSSGSAKKNEIFERLVRK